MTRHSLCTALTLGLAWMALVLSTGCSNRQMYESLQAGKRQQCQKMAEPDRSRCLEEANRRYDPYERERELIRPN